MTEGLGASAGERTADRLGYRAGYYSRGLVTRIGKLELRVPRDREGRFSTDLFDRYQRSEKALVSALAEMYGQGVSTRKVKMITEALCGHTFSASTISRINKSLDAVLHGVDDDLGALLREAGGVGYLLDERRLRQAAVGHGFGCRQEPDSDQGRGCSTWLWRRSSRHCCCCRMVCSTAGATSLPTSKTINQLEPTSKNRSASEWSVPASHCPRAMPDVTPDAINAAYRHGERFMAQRFT